MKNYIDTIRAFSEAKGISGFEDEVVAVARSLAPAGLDIREDSLRNLYLRRSGAAGRPVVQLDAHMDEVGFMVHSIRPNGTLKFITIGGWVATSIPAHRVWVQSKDGCWIPGVTAAKPPHFMSAAEKNAMPAVEDMSIDIGASSLAEARDVYGIRIAAPVVPDVAFEYDAAHDSMIGKAFDCRLGCAALMATLTELGDEALDVDVVGALSTQEEVGLRGASVSANTVRADVAIVFEGTPADDTTVPPAESQTAIRKGPMLRHIDARMITNPRFLRFALDIGQALGIPVQEAVRTGGATNGGAIHLAQQGIPTIVIGLPVRYIHSHYGIAAYADFENAVKLGLNVIRRLNADVIAGF